MVVICKQRIYISPSVLSRLYEMNYPKASVNSVIIYDHGVLENDLLGFCFKKKALSRRIVSECKRACTYAI